MSNNDNGLITLRDAPRRRKRDFITLFNALWYRDFPIIRGHEAHAGRAMWTTHIASVVKGCADLMGFFALFGQGNRTDTIIKTAMEKTWAKVEWEWKQPIREQVNEINKLSMAAENNEADIYIYIGYADERKLSSNIEAITKQWPHHDKHLLVFLISYEVDRRTRRFRTLQTYHVVAAREKKLREQYALPWDVPGSRWEASARVASSSRDDAKEV